MQCGNSLFCDFEIFSPSDGMCSLFIVKFHFHYLIDVHLYKCFTCMDINKNV